MIALYKAIRAFKADRESSFVHYASLCIDNQLYNVIKGANRLKNSPLNTYVSLYSPLNSDTENNSRETLADTLQPSELINPEDIVIDKENVTDIESHIEKHLSKFEKEVVTLYLDGNDYQQIAVVLGKSPKSIDNALQGSEGSCRRFDKKMRSWLVGFWQLLLLVVCFGCLCRLFLGAIFR